jgi:threonine dehydrogenase-like Zn-dependent dehydrogenase
MNSMKEDLAEGLTKHFGEVNVYGHIVPDVDIFIDAAGAPVLFENVMKIVKSQVKISIIAVYKNEVPVSLAQIMSKELHIQGASGYTHEDITKVIEHLTNKKTNISNIVTQVYKLDDIQEAFNVAIEAKGAIKVVVDLS